MTTLTNIPVFYSPEMVADSLSFSPGAAKPAAVVESWLSLGLPFTIQAPLPVSRAQIKRAHEPAFVDSILDGTADNGFGNRSRAVAASLPYTSGAMLGAAREALRNGAVASAPVCGFHHANYDSCGGYCTFNGLIVAVQALLLEGLADRVGILDCDQHYGDGTDDCIRELELTAIRHFTAGGEYRFANQAETFLQRLPEIVHQMKDCDLILYQAGADPHIDDPLGGWLTSEQLGMRDRLVFQTARALGIPIAWNLAGGYQKPLSKVVAIHDRTMIECARIYCRRDRGN